MSINKKHYFRYLAEKAEGNELSETEEALVDNFLKRTYDRSGWTHEISRDKEVVKLSILGKIKKRKVERNILRYAVAASISLFLCLSILLFLVQRGPVVRKFATVGRADSILLKDGSLVFLAANSEFEYPEEFTGASREVKLLKGDAFFKIAKDPEHPFIIRSGSLKTTVLGTSFHIALAENSCTVAVAKGKVNVSTGNRSLDLLPDEEAFYQNDVLKKQEGRRELLSGWFRKDLHLNQVPLSDVFTVLKFRYGVKFDIKEPGLLDNRVTLYVESSAPLKNVLSQINYITSLKFKQHDKTIKVSK